jgi:GxxExxY protein
LYLSRRNIMTKLIYADLTYILRGTFFEVYRDLKGTGISEASWEEALCTVWQAQNIPFKRQPAYELGYKDHHLALFYPDLIAYDKILVELKAIAALCPINRAQVLSHLKATDLKLGLLVNFGGGDIEIERVPNFLAQRSTAERPMRMSVRDDLLYPELTYAIREPYSKCTVSLALVLFTTSTVEHRKSSSNCARFPCSANRRSPSASVAECWRPYRVVC